MAGRPDLDEITATQLNLKLTYCSYLTDIYELTNLLEMCSKLFLPPPPGLKNAPAVGVAEKDTPYSGDLHSQTLADASRTHIVILVL